MGAHGGRDGDGQTTPPIPYSEENHAGAPRSWHKGSEMSINRYNRGQGKESIVLNDSLEWNF